MDISFLGRSFTIYELNLHNNEYEGEIIMSKADYDYLRNIKSRINNLTFDLKLQVGHIINIWHDVKFKNNGVALTDKRKINFSFKNKSNKNEVRK
jgi:hypothetical protein